MRSLRDYAVITASYWVFTLTDGALRTLVLKDGVAYVQAGAGIVAASVPASEEAETRAKASALLSAIRAADAMTTATP